MKDIYRIKRNIIIFAGLSSACGWAGYFADKLSGQAYYENVGITAGKEPFGMLIWLAAPLLCTILLRTFGGDGWKNAGFALNLKTNEKLYLFSFLIYPAVTLSVILLGTITKGIKFSAADIGIKTYTGILLTQIVVQFVKNIFEESVWRAYLTNQLLKLSLSDWKIYLLVGFIWWIWHLPYVMIFLSESEIQATLPVGRPIFFLIGIVVVTAWTVMYTEVFRMTNSVWPSVIMHTMEDAVINPLLLLGMVSVEKSQAVLFSLSVGMVPTILYLVAGLYMRRERIKREQYRQPS